MCKTYSHSYACGCIAPNPNNDSPVIERCRSWKANKQHCKPDEIKHQIIRLPVDCTAGGCPGWQVIDEDFEEAEQYRDELRKEKQDERFHYGAWKGERENSQEYFYHNPDAYRPHGYPRFKLQPRVERSRQSSGGFVADMMEHIAVDEDDDFANLRLAQRRGKWK